MKELKSKKDRFRFSVSIYNNYFTMSLRKWLKDLLT